MRSTRWGCFLIVGLSAGMLAACGGGGGGEDGVQYTGKATPAVLTAQNATLVADGLSGGVPTALDLSSGGGLFKVPGGEGPGPARLSLRDLGRLLSDRVEAALLLPDAGRAERAAARREQGSMEGSCGGTVRFDLEANDDTGGFEGTLRFSSDYCEGDVHLAGGVSVRGQVDLVYVELAWLEMSTDLLTLRDPGPSEPTDTSLTGIIRVEGSPGSVRLDVALRDNLAQQVVRFDDFTVGYDDEPGGIAVTVSGRYYDPAEGYVDFVTEQPLLLSQGDDGPSAGVVTAVGAAGASSRLTALSGTTCRIDADLNGDGDYGDAGTDFSSGVLYWSDL